MTEHYLTHPLDETSRGRLAERGLTLSLVDPEDVDARNAWFQADVRGFLGGRASAERLDEARDYQADRRTTGVHDPRVGAVPVATSQGWIAELTLPGLTTVPSWAISSVTVAPTHRRLGIATAMLEAELRTASALGLPVAVLTVSESTIYHRFGFGPATWLAGFEIETKRERWRGRPASGSLRFVEPEEFRETGRAVLDRARRARVGEIEKSRYLADRLTGPLASNPKKDDHRVVRFDDAAGECQGFVVYTVAGNDEDFAMAILTVQHLVALTDDAYLALWRFLVEHDLVGIVRTFTTAVDEPLPHLLTDFRRAKQVWLEDHLWARVLDVPAALAARRYERDGSVVLRVDDPLGFAAGVFRLDVTGGVGTVTRLEPAVPTDAGTTDAGGVPAVDLAVTALGSLLLGGMSAGDLALRGELTGDVALVDALFRTARPPHLGSWF
ncbi:GNAT family N-acetyltransferase [Galbitalea sp. SE-J8]|uniref:GNAT family N-acetyltransferase n=1 Tax=Galbitalea sp. SE-J8 TaxID=3054952 RepID=UPI00259D1BC8|nr:GNAT family N-acetyltransferase [Galbitalea sp. SE-J8]MDM4762153.1 GNAT family N-acetyltransferase [Galbitalea sp. SE-J8]